MSLFVELASLRHLKRHPAQLACAIAGVALGVAAVVGIDLAIDSTARAFELSTRALTGAATHTLAGGPEGLDERLYAELVRARGSVALAPALERSVRVVIGDAAPARRLTLIGVDPLAEAALRPWLRAGGPGAGAQQLPGAVFLAADTARELGLAPGDGFRLAVDAWTAPVHLAGVLAPADELAARALADVCVADIAVAQELARANGRLSRIDFAAPPGARGDADLARLATLLPPGLALQRADERAGALAGLASAFEQNLRALSLLALLVGAFLVYNTATFSVVQRRELFGALRALGASRGAVVRAVLGEALWIALLGTALGLAAGFGLARLLIPHFARSINDLYFAVAVERIDVAAATLAKGAAIGLVATLAGAAVPAIEASFAPPRNALARSMAEQRARRGIVPLALGGVALALASLAAVRLGPQTLAAGLAVLFLALFSAALIAPWFTSVAARAAARPCGRALGFVGRIAARGIDQSLSRTATAVAALAVALGAAFAMAAMIASFRSTVVDWLDATLRADVFVSAPHAVGARQTSRLDPGLVARLAALPGVEGIGTFRGFELATARGAVYAAAIEEPARGRASYRLLRGDPAAAWSALEDHGALFVSESFARRRGLAPGAELALPTAEGERAFPIAAVYQDFSTDSGIVLMARRTAEASWPDRAVSALGFYLAPGVDPDEFRRRIDAALGAEDRVFVRTNSGLRQASLEVFDRTFAVAAALKLLATLVAAVACLSSLMALELERAREFGLLRAEGLTPWDAARLVLARSSLLGLIAAALALPLGLALSLLLVDVIQPRAFGWTLAWRLEPAAMLETVALALGAALIAGLYPAWRIARADTARSLRAD